MCVCVCVWGGGGGGGCVCVVLMHFFHSACKFLLQSCDYVSEFDKILPFQGLVGSC